MATRTLTAKELFDPEFLESLQRLHILARRVARSGRPADQRSRDMGSGIEFRDFRPYTAGDDFRAIDWTIYRRLGRVFLRLFEELEDLPVYLVTDVSESMYTEDRPRAWAGLRAAMALAAISLGQHDSVGLFTFADDLETVLRPQSGRGRLMRFAHALADATPRGATSFETAFQRLSSLNLRSGLVVVISDFFDAAGLDAVIAALKRVRHRLLLVQLFRTEDRRPDVSGDFEMLDCETGDSEDVSATPTVLELYKKAYDRFQSGLVQFARQRDLGLLQLDADREVVPQLATLFETGSYVV